MAHHDFNSDGLLHTNYLVMVWHDMMTALCGVCIQTRTCSINLCSLSLRSHIYAVFGLYDKCKCVNNTVFFPISLAAAFWIYQSMFCSSGITISFLGFGTWGFGCLVFDIQPLALPAIERWLASSWKLLELNWHGVSWQVLWSKPCKDGMHCTKSLMLTEALAWLRELDFSILYCKACWSAVGGFRDH